jgi:isoleucyl-tRNA synthetase
MFQPVDSQISFPKMEERVLDFWCERNIYQKSLDQNKEGDNFVFFEGPPTANGLPHPGHCLTRAVKDLFPRYKSMQGFRCERKAGWDTHGLPVEVEVCKEMGIHSKDEIEEFGVEPFIHKCQQSVWRYMKEWEQLTERLGFWIKLDEAYVTYHQSYVESVWWSLKNLFDRGLLYQGHKIVWWWAQGGTALSSGEVGQGYRETADPSVYVLFPILERENTSLLVWTTTPWTLPSNQFAAVHDEIEYATVYDAELDHHLIFAADLVESIGQKLKRELQVVSTCEGSELVGLRYRPPFDYYYNELGDVQHELKNGGTEHINWRILSADFVTTDSGTGAVHEAPAFGEVDYDLLMSERSRFVEGQGPELICDVQPNGKFNAKVSDFKDLWVKDADKPIIRSLKDKGLLYFHDQYLHDYPFCWRADNDPLIQYPRRSWFIRTTEFRDEMLKNNQKINWLPDHIKDGRFGNFLESNVDWALSRERYWGTPLPIWVCEQTGQMEAIASYAELLGKPGVTGTDSWEKAKAKSAELPEDLKVHKPYVDDITYDSPFADGARMKRVSEVIDCWYDSGAMPFAQWGWPHQNQDQFNDQFPADFISEALDQTRGWFYSLLAISTLLFGEKNENAPKTCEYPHPFANCIVLGLMLAETYYCEKCDKRYLNEVQKCEQCGGKVVRKIEKMSKRLRNYREPAEIFNNYGADALRWYFFANQPPWNSINYSERAIKESIPEFLLRLWNVYGFLVLYAGMDNFDPAAGTNLQSSQLTTEDLSTGQHYRPVKQRSELDRWLMSELHQAIDVVTTRMDQYDNYGACDVIVRFVDSLSNWYVRRSRDRFWSEDKADTDKLDAYWTLYECMLSVAKLIAPFVPFVSEEIWRNLSGTFNGAAVESVHLCRFPTCDRQLIDPSLSQRMDLLREIASLGRAARMEAKLKVRQPLAGVTVVLSNTADIQWLKQHDSILKEELNVKSIDYQTDAGQFVTYRIQPNFKRVGPRVGALMPKVKNAITNADGADLLAQLNASGKVVMDIDGQSVEFDNEDLQVRLEANEGWSASQGKSCVVVLSTELTPELIREGLARDVVRFIQDRRKELNLQYSDRIELCLVTESDELKHALTENEDYICRETLAISISYERCNDVDSITKEIGDATIEIFLTVAKQAMS